METIPLAGSEPATHGGPGWRGRLEPHRAELGRYWEPCGVSSEVAPLRKVLLVEPPDTLVRVLEDPNAWLMLEAPDLEEMRRQFRDLAAAYEEEGVQVHRARVPQAPPNAVFARDLFFMTPEGAVLGRMAGQVRAGEERHAASALASLGIPLLLTPRGRATFEGADALWLREDLVLLGVGVRTNPEGAAQVAALLEAMGVRSLQVRLPSGVQHLLGVVDFVDHDLAVVRRDRIPEELRGILHTSGVRLLELDPVPEVVGGRAMNFVTLRPGRILMPAGCPTVRRVFEQAGISCREVAVGEYLKAAGGPGCLTGILWRASSGVGESERSRQ